MAAWVSPWAAWGTMLGIQVLLALAELMCRRCSTRRPPRARTTGVAPPACLRLHVPLQAALLALGAVAGELCGAGVWRLRLRRRARAWAWAASRAARASPSRTNSATRRSRFDRVLAWALMASVRLCALHGRALPRPPPARRHLRRPGVGARRGESLWRFLPRTLAGSWASAWRLEARQLAATAARLAAQPAAVGHLRLQAAWLAARGHLAGAAGAAVLGWCSPAYAVFLLGGHQLHRTLRPASGAGVNGRPGAVRRAACVERRPCLLTNSHDRQPAAPQRPPYACLEALRHARGLAGTAAAYWLRGMLVPRVGAAAVVPRDAARGWPRYSAPRQPAAPQRQASRPAWCVSP
ncbi:MAG: hypothetical protein MZW92_72865 [Comamonadaceae bacterium]|nr:hypothetical protein [Comamonadaceae bacterium]